MPKKNSIKDARTIGETPKHKELEVLLSFITDTHEGAQSPFLESTWKKNLSWVTVDLIKARSLLERTFEQMTNPCDLGDFLFLRQEIKDFLESPKE